MSYRFCFGASGAGKSTELKKLISRQSGEAIRRLVNDGRDPDAGVSFLYIVPEQYTMQTQKDLVEASENASIMNVDVLSFGRLSHRIFEELGVTKRAALDDIGKSLILRKVAGECRDRLQVLGKMIDRPGMIGEVKSMISEFMQYSIDTKGVSELSSFAGQAGQRALEARLNDLGILYENFLEYEKDKFITGEETLDLLAEAISSSVLIKNSVIVFDGFTGFTPVQYNVLSALMQNAGDVIFSITISDDSGPAPSMCEVETTVINEQDLFYLSRKTIRAICKVAKEAGVEHGEDIYVSPSGQSRFSKSPEIEHLENTVFRYPVVAYNLPTDKIHVIEVNNPEEEARRLFIRIRELVRTKGYEYRDFAVVLGNLAGYEDVIRKMSAEYEVPVYIDSTKSIVQNPLIETVKCALQIGAGDYSYETVFSFLRAGLCDLTLDEIDRLENYCLARGVGSRSKWNLPFDEGTRFGKDIEKLRLRVLGSIECLADIKDKSAAVRTAALYEFLVGINAQEKLEAYAEHFREIGDNTKAAEFGGIYKEIIDLLDQIYELIGDEKISGKEYLEIISAGFDEIRLGILPQKVDRVLVGDMERSRFSEVKVLFFLGANDGNVPRNTSKGGVISDLDREFLENSGLELAPTPREEMYIQRLYLYMNLTKETDMLEISYCKQSADGSSIRPSYLIKTMLKMYPKITIERPMTHDINNLLIGGKDTAAFMAEGIRCFMDGLYDADEEKVDLFLTIYGYMMEREMNGADSLPVSMSRLTDAALSGYTPVPLSRELALRLYGHILKGNITRLECAAKCYREHFLKYGLKLRRRDARDFESTDFGTIIHDSILAFSLKLKEDGKDWDKFEYEYGKELADRVLLETALNYDDQLMTGSSRALNQTVRMQRIMERTIDTLQYQLTKGKFKPYSYETDFGYNEDFCFDLGDNRKLMLQGRIDRVDICRDSNGIYVKIIDYKSSSKKLEPDKIKAGLSLQLILYMESQLRHFGDKSAPAGMLYYKYTDPVLKNDDANEAAKDADNSMNDEICRVSVERIRKLLRAAGLVNSAPEIAGLIDDAKPGQSFETVTGVRVKKDGTYYGNNVISTEEYRTLAADAQNVSCTLAGNILDGEIMMNPVNISSRETACTYCDFKDVCGFDPRIKGFGYRDIPKTQINEKGGKEKDDSKKKGGNQ